MPITDPQAIRYNNEEIRMLAEKGRDFKVEIDAATAKWFGGIDAKFTADPSATIEDGRESEGVSRMIGSDAINLMTQLLAIQTQMNQPGVAGIFSKPTVRPLRTNG